MALCSLSTGRRSTPAACAAAITSSPAATRTSLLERAICLPCWIAAYVASRPTTPTAAETSSSTSGCVPTASKPSLPHWMSGKGARPWARSRPASSSARAAFATETSCGRWRAIWEAIRSMFSPAARASTQKRDGSDSTTLRHCLPIDPVDPRMARRFKTCLFSIPCLPHSSTRPGVNGAGFPAGVERGRIVVRTLLDFLGLCTRGSAGGLQHQLEIIPDHGHGENKGVYPVEHSAVPRQQPAGIFGPRTAFIGGLGQIAHLACNIGQGCAGEHGAQADPGPARKENTDGKRGKQICRRTFPGFVRAEVRRHSPPANGTPDEIGCRIACPNQNQGEKQEFRSDTRHSLEWNPEAQGQSDKEQPGGTGAQGRQSFGEGPASREHDYGCTDNEHEKKKRKQGEGSSRGISFQEEAACDRKRLGTCCQKLYEDQGQGAGAGPNPVSPMTNPFAEGKVFQQR